MKEFDKFAHEYKTILDKSLELSGERGEYFADYKANYIRRKVGKNFSGNILEYGCGIGLLSEALLKTFPGSVVDGFDDSSVSINYVSNRLKEQGRFTSDIDRINRAYDLIVIANVLHHIDREGRKDVIARLKNMVKPGGKIFIFEHNTLNPVTRATIKNSPLDQGVTLLPFGESWQYLKKTGYKKINMDYIVFFPKNFSFLRWAEPFLCWLPLGAQYAVNGRVD